MIAFAVSWIDFYKDHKTNLYLVAELVAHIVTTLKNVTMLKV